MRALRAGLPKLCLLLVVLAGAACGSSPTPAGAPPSGERAPASVVVTYSVLGSLVRELVGGTATVTVLMPNGVDPHDWQPSAKDVAAINRADLVVVNGAGLEEALDESLAEAQADGVRIFTAADHVALRQVGEGELAGDAQEHTVGADDPHLWTDPLAMRDVVTALARTLDLDLGLDVGRASKQLAARLDALDDEIERLLAPIPTDRRTLVTGHESLGYFADRYGLTVIGAIIPGLTSQASASASELAGLEEQIRRAGVGAVFTEIGTPRQVADAVAADTDAVVVELPSHNLPGDGSYFTFMRTIATRIAGALTG